MAIFSNQATLTYNGNTTNSNIAYGEILEVLESTAHSIINASAVGQIIHISNEEVEDLKVAFNLKD